MAAPDHREEAGRVLEAQGDVVARLQARGAEHVREAVRLLVELGVGDDLAAGGHDHGRPVGGGGGEGSRGTWRQGSRRYRGAHGRGRRPRASRRWSRRQDQPLPARRGAAAHRRARRPDLDVDARAGPARRAGRRGRRSPPSTALRAAPRSSDLGLRRRPGHLLRPPRTRCSPSVLDRRLGIPLSLPCSPSRWAGGAASRVEGIGMPGHYLVRPVGRRAAPLPRRLRRRPRARRRGLPGGCFERAAGRGAVGRRATSAPTSPAAIVRPRCSRNLAGAYRRAGDREALCWALELRLLLPERLATGSGASSACCSARRAATPRPPPCSRAPAPRPTPRPPSACEPA